MRLLTNGISKLVFVCIVCLQGVLFAKEISVNVGIYDFTDQESKVIYKSAPFVSASIDLYEVSQLSLNLSAGVATREVEYYTDTYRLTVIPVTLAFRYDLLDQNSRFYPYIGGGITMNLKIDENPYYHPDKEENELLYGYVAMAGVCVPLKPFILTGNMRYNIVIPSEYLESPNISAITSTIGFSFPFGKGRK